MLVLDRLTKTFGGFTAVADVSFTVERGAIHAVIGPNGAGKTTLFNLVTGVLAPSAGRLVFDGDDITGWRADRITARGLARTFQNIRLFRGMTTIENVLIGAHCRTTGGFVDASAFDAYTTGVQQSGFVLRGYEPSQFKGTNYNLLNLEYRFPLLYVDRGISTLPGFLRTLSGVAFLDY